MKYFCYKRIISFWYRLIKKHPPIKAEFTGEPFDKAMGFITTEFSHDVGRSFDVTFKIDTAAYYTVLMDEDFINACMALGWSPFIYPDVLNWISINDKLFQNQGTADTIAGKTNEIYLIRNSKIKYYQIDGCLRDVFSPEIPIYGSFSSEFMQKDTSPSHNSLLGVDHLNRLRSLFWNWPRKIIKLTP